MQWRKKPRVFEKFLQFSRVLAHRERRAVAVVSRWRLDLMVRLDGLADLLPGEEQFLFLFALGFQGPELPGDGQ